MLRLKELRQKYCLKRSDLSRAIGISQATLANYENEIREASYDTLICISNFFNVSIDYLLGNDYNEKYHNKIKEDNKLSSEERILIDSFRKATTTQKNKIIEIIQILLKE